MGNESGKAIEAVRDVLALEAAPLKIEGNRLIMILSRPFARDVFTGLSSYEAGGCNSSFKFLFMSKI